MKCFSKNCDSDGAWTFQPQNDAAEVTLCDRCFRTMSDNAFDAMLNFEKGSIFGQAAKDAKALENQELVIEISPAPKVLAPNIQLAVIQSTLMISELCRRYRLTHVQKAIASQMLCRTLSLAGKNAHAEACKQN